MKYIDVLVNILRAFALASIVSCTPQNGSSMSPTPSHESVIGAWYAHSYEFFLNTQHTNTKDFAKQLNDTLIISTNDSCNASVTQTSFTKNILAHSAPEKNGNPARIAIEQKQLQQFLAHQFASFGSVQLSESDRALLQENEQITQENKQIAKYLESLSSLGEQFDVFTNGKLEIYEASDTTSLFAYKRTLGNTRAFIAFNFSFDTHELPLPFGFMTSTKITLWQSDDIQTSSFVTSQALSIRPYTAVIVIVG